VVSLIVLTSGVSNAQSRLDLGGLPEVGGEAERYLRVLQIAGALPLMPWSIQPFTPVQAAELRTPRAHPWADRFDTSTSGTLSDGRRMLRPKARLIANSAFPIQDGIGPTWAGRGFTGEVQAGVTLRRGIVSAQLAPLAFAAQNASFTLAPNGTSGRSEFRDARFPSNIDAPQRFGNATYSRVLGGTSFLTIDPGFMVASLGTAPNRWGPARDYPLTLGPNAGGFPSLYLGSSRPWDLWLFKLSARLIYGALGQSSFADSVGGERRRLGSGAVVAITPRGVPGLELGVTRFIHRPWPRDGFGFVELIRPLYSGISLSDDAGNNAPENQLASVFMRWAFPEARVELYGEMYREDLPGRFHAAPSPIEKPDDLASFVIGLQRVIAINNQSIWVARAELVNGETSHQERNERGFVYPIPPYTHTLVTQGHTLDGLMLGSPEAYGGAAWRMGFDHFSPRGRESLALERSLRFDWLPTLTSTKSVRPDVLYGIRGELLRFHGRREYGVTLMPSIDLNRNLVAGSDAFNLTAAVTVRGW
jgi:hypothetical protein